MPPADDATTRIVLHQFEFSPFCDKVRRILAVKNVPYETRNISLLASLTGAIKRLSGQTKLPVLEIDGTHYADSTEIAYELERRFPEPALIPDDDEARSLVHLLEDWADESLYFLEAHLRYGLEENLRALAPAAFSFELPFMRPFAVPLMGRAISSMTSAQGTGRKREDELCVALERHLASLERLLSKRSWLVGGELTLADIAVYSQLQCIAQTPQGQAALGQHPATTRWLVSVATATGGFGDPEFHWSGPE